MSLAAFIPQIWSARLETALRAGLVYAQAGIINRDYEGAISQQGDTVRINSVGDPTIKAYGRGDIDAPETLTSAQQVLTIAQSDYFNFEVNDVDAVQANMPLLDRSMQNAGYGLAAATDTYVAGLMAAAPGTTIGSSGTPKTITAASDMYELLVDMGTALTEANVPEDNRFVVVPAWAEGVLLKDARYVSFGTAANVQNLMNRSIGRVSGMTVVVSNRVPNTGGNVSGGKLKIVAGHPMATTYADQIVKTEAFRPQNRFSDAIKGLHVYDAKVIRPEALCLMWLTRP